MPRCQYYSSQVTQSTIPCNIHARVSRLSADDDKQHWYNSIEISTIILILLERFIQYINVVCHHLFLMEIREQDYCTGRYSVQPWLLIGASSCLRSTNGMKIIQYALWVCLVLTKFLFQTSSETSQKPKNSICNRATANRAFLLYVIHQ